MAKATGTKKGGKAKLAVKKQTLKDLDASQGKGKGVKGGAATNKCLNTDACHTMLANCA